MKIISALVLCMLSSLSSNNSSEEVIQKMYQRYAGKWMHSFTFNQTTENYRNDSLIKTAIWYLHHLFIFYRYFGTLVLIIEDGRIDMENGRPLFWVFVVMLLGVIGFLLFRRYRLKKKILESTTNEKQQSSLPPLPV